MKTNVILFSTRIPEKEGGFFQHATKELFKSDELIAFFKETVRIDDAALSGVKTKIDVRAEVIEKAIAAGMNEFDAEKLDLNDSTVWGKLKEKAPSTFHSLENAYKEAPSSTGQVADNCYVEAVKGKAMDPSWLHLNRFSIYTLKDATSSVYAYAVWPLEKTEDRSMVWENALLAEIKARHKDLGGVILALHDLDVGSQRTFSVLHLKDEKAPNLTECVFQHSPTDPIMGILDGRTKLALEDVFEYVEKLCAKLHYMIESGKNHETLKAYQNNEIQ